MVMREYIKSLNDAYRAGNPVVSDEEYDRLLEEYYSVQGSDLKTDLLEPGGPVKHKYPVGSLNKCTFGTTGLADWIKKYNVKNIIISAKIDGMAIVCKYSNGKLVQAATRGDGWTGEDITDKVEFIESIPKTIPYVDDIELRGELLVTENGAVANNYQNRRNGTVGIIKRKECTDDLKYIECYFHGVLGNISISQQLSILRNIKNTFPELLTPYFIPMDISGYENIELALADTVRKQNSLDYICDGLVVYDADYINEDSLHPDRVIAFKVNKEGVLTSVTGIDWKTSKNGNIKPVVRLEPVYIDGTTISRATGYNWKFILDNEIGIGAKVKINKSGEIIPRILEVVEVGTVDPLLFCPSCGNSVKMKGVEAYCDNFNCDAQELRQLTHFLRNCNIKGANEKSLEKWNVASFNDILHFVPDTKSKSQVSFKNEIEEKIFTLSPEEMFSKMSFNGSGEKSINKILEIHQLKDFANHCLKQIRHMELPDGVGEKTIENIAADVVQNYKIVVEYMNNGKLIKHKRVNVIQCSRLKGKSFCLTGTMTRKRNEIERLIIENGGSICSVNKSLNFLVVGSDAGSKLKKAQELGTMILNETQLMKMIGG